MRTPACCAMLLLAAVSAPDSAAEKAEPSPTDRRAGIEALKPFNHLIGDWRCTGRPGGSRPGGKDSWRESASWTWSLEGEVAIRLKVKDGKALAEGVLTYDAGRKAHLLTAVRTDGQKVVYAGPYDKEKDVLTLAADLPATKERERLVFRLLHDNRYLLAIDRGKDEASLARVADLGCTKEGEPFAKLPTGPVCVITGGQPAGSVTYKGKNYPICCSGCRDLFKKDPEGCLAEAVKSGYLPK